jgi:hypothetical protein
VLPNLKPLDIICSCRVCTINSCRIILLSMTFYHASGSDVPIELYNNNYDHWSNHTYIRHKTKSVLHIYSINLYLKSLNANYYNQTYRYVRHQMFTWPRSSAVWEGWEQPKTEQPSLLCARAWEQPRVIKTRLFPVFSHKKLGNEVLSQLEANALTIVIRLQWNMIWLSWAF